MAESFKWELNPVEDDGDAEEYYTLVQKATALYDVLQYGAPQPFVAPRTAPADAVPPEPNPTSNLIRLAYDADSLELPPQIFW